jgi:hypothetical protein
MSSLQAEREDMKLKHFTIHLFKAAKANLTP